MYVHRQAIVSKLCKFDAGDFGAHSGENIPPVPSVREFKDAVIILALYVGMQLLLPRVWNFSSCKCVYRVSGVLKE